MGDFVEKPTSSLHTSLYTCSPAWREMRFSSFVGINIGSTDDWFDPIITEDTPLYIDPFLVFNDKTSYFADSHDMVVDFFATCSDLVKRAQGNHESAYWKKAVRLLTFPEPREFALGLSMGSPNGAGTDEVFAGQMAEALEVLTKVDRDIDYVDMFALFVPGIGVDRISDIFCNILKDRFIAYTGNVCEKHGVIGEWVTVKNASWSPENGRWSEARIRLPKSPITGTAVLLAPERFLQNIPQQVTQEGFWSWAESNHNRELREDLNYNLANALNRKEKREHGRKLALKRPEMAFEYVDDVAQEDRKPYNVGEDPELLIKWYEEGRKAGEVAAEEYSELLGQPKSPSEFHAWVGRLAERFAYAVEETDLWRAFWNDALTTPRKEKIVQAVAHHVWGPICQANNVDIGREVNLGRGPVDFKFSAGWEMRTHLEVKLMNNPKIKRGAEAQLKQYMKTEGINSRYYVCVGFRDREFGQEQLDVIKETCQALQEEAGYKVTPVR
ncbi:hypothetical protein AB0L13_45295 [Saccharopolyspora shandongensis]|uniref:hypothetical protein n=1 Tax=Saccharopolyspora shandongensis TaxID=418495 RepID=UPI0034154B77